MKFTLTITDASPSDLIKLLSSVGGAAIAVTAAPPVQVAPVEDDEAGDTAVAPGSVDSSGIPHDPRIHSEPPKQTGKGVWRKRRGVDDAEVARVEAELRARTAAPVAQPQPTFTPPPVQQPQPTFTPPPMQFSPPPVQAGPPTFTPPPVTAAAPVAQPVTTAAPTDFPSFMNGLQGLLNAGRVDHDYLAGLVQRINSQAQTQFQAITDINTRPDLVGWVWQLMHADGRA